MSIHEAFLGLAAAAIDFDLQDDDRAELDRHLAACATCRRTAEAFMEDAAVIASGGGPRLSPARSEAILAAALQPPRSGPPIRLLAAGALVALLAIGLVAVGAEIIRRSQEPPVAVGPSPTGSSATGPSLGPTTEPPSPDGTPHPAAAPTAGILPVRGPGRELGTDIRMAPGRGGDLWVSIPGSEGTVLVRLDPGGQPRPGWPILLPGASPCRLLLPVGDGSVRLVCRAGDLLAHSGADPAVRAYAFDSGGNPLTGWPVELPCCFTGRVIGDELTLYARQTVGDVFEAGKPAGNAWMTTVAADGAVRRGTQVVLLGDCCLDSWAVGPDGVAYGTLHQYGAAPTSELAAVSFTGTPAGFPVPITGIASGTAFDAHGRIHVTVGSPIQRPARTLVFGADGSVIDAGSDELDIAATSDWSGAGAEFPSAPLVGLDGTTFVLDTIDGTTAQGLGPAGQVLPGWPYRTDLGLEDAGFCGESDTGCGQYRAGPAVGHDATLYLLHAAATSSAGGSVVAIGRDGRVRDGWPVALRRVGAEFWSVVVSPDGNAYALAIEPEPNGSHSATILSLAPNSDVQYTTTIIEP